jgi:predicted  nucleic acid-binding Zn-ribbon protein
MEWRCAWCGKPHEANDPPCDNCGHNKFERAIEQVPATDADPQGSVWVCPECGRQHQKHSPPCSRCGNLTLEQRHVSELDDPLDDIQTRWRDVVEPRYVAGYVAVGILLLVLGLGALGVVDLPGFGEPEIPDAPGEAQTAGNVSLDAVKREFVVALNDRRQNASAEPLSTDDTLGRMAEYYTNATVAETFGDGDGPDRDALNSFEPDCSGRITLLLDVTPTAASGDDVVAAAATPHAAATGLLSELESHPNFEDLLEVELDAVGVDVHVAPDDRVFVTVVAC